MVMNDMNDVEFRLEPPPVSAQKLQQASLLEGFPTYLPGPLTRAQPSRHTLPNLGARMLAYSTRQAPLYHSSFESLTILAFRLVVHSLICLLRARMWWSSTVGRRVRLRGRRARRLLFLALSHCSMLSLLRRGRSLSDSWIRSYMRTRECSPTSRPETIPAVTRTASRYVTAGLWFMEILTQSPSGHHWMGSGKLMVVFRCFVSHPLLLGYWSRHTEICVVEDCGWLVMMWQMWQMMMMMITFLSNECFEHIHVALSSRILHQFFHSCIFLVVCLFLWILFMSFERIVDWEWHA